MALKILPKRVYIEELMAELDLCHMPVIRSLKTVLLYSEYDALPILFDDNVVGIEANIPIGEQFDDNGDFIDYRVAAPDQLIEINGPKTIMNAFSYFSESDEKYYISISSFHQNSILYSIPDNSGTKLVELDLNIDKCYCGRDQLRNFIIAMENSNKAKNKASANKQMDNVVTPEMKALAMLARETAIRTPRFRSGSNVNASAFKNHIINLAKEYNQSDHGLKSLDDKINKTLKELDIKEIPDQNNS